MDFNFENDLSIFDELFEKRPEVSKENLTADLKDYYLPFIKRLVDLKKDQSGGLIVGVSAIQGAGKTTQGEILEILLKHFGYQSDSLSIDDHYITHRELCELRERDPRFIRRGVTHDIPLAILELRNLREMEGETPILVSGYDKGAHHGDGDRFRWIRLEEGVTIKVKVVEEELVVSKEKQMIKALQLLKVFFNGTEIFMPRNMGSDVPIVDHLLPANLVEWLQGVEGEITVAPEGEDQVKFSAALDLVIPKKDLPNGWRVVTKKPDFVFYDGWMLGARRVVDESVFESGLPALDTEEAKAFAKDVNKKLENYEPLWQMIKFMNVLYVPNYQMSVEWRDQAENVLREKGEGMTHEQITEFVHYFWRSVHPAIHIKNLAHDSVHTQQVVVIGDDHLVKKVVAPAELNMK